MTRRERYIRLFKGEEVDRPAIKLWSLTHGQPLLHPDYRPVYELGVRTADLYDGGACPFDCVFGFGHDRIRRERRQISEDWDEETLTLDTGGKPLTRVNRLSRAGKPGYTMERFVKDENDLRAILDMPYAPYPADLSQYARAVERVGDDGVAMYGLTHPAYEMYELMGSETLALLTVESHGLLEQTVELYSSRLLAHVKNLIDAGLPRLYDFLACGWVGPELFIPPLLSPADFDCFCFKPDKKLIDLIHDAGGYVWVHCHGKVRGFIGRFVEMGCDMLNPIEPPPMGDITLREAFAMVDGKMALEGNIQIGDVMTASADEIRHLVDRALDECENRFVLGLTAGYMEVPEPPAVLIDNLMLFLTYGLERLQAMAHNDGSVRNLGCRR